MIYGPSHIDLEVLLFGCCAHGSNLKAQDRLLTELEWYSPSMSRSRRIRHSHEEQVSFEIWLLIGRTSRPIQMLLGPAAWSRSDGTHAER